MSTVLFWFGITGIVAVCGPPFVYMLGMFWTMGVLRAKYYHYLLEEGEHNGKTPTQ